MQEIKLPIEVRLVIRDKQLPDAFELLQELQDIVDQWYWSKIPTIPCVLIKKGNNAR